MKTSIKYFLFLIAIVLAVLAPPRASAQAGAPIYDWQTLSIPALVNVNTVSNGVGALMDVRKQGNVALSVNTGIGTNITYRLSASIDGTTWHTNYMTINFNTVAVTAQPNITNLSCLGIGWLRVESITNASATLIATNTARYGIKISSP